MVALILFAVVTTLFGGAGCLSCFQCNSLPEQEDCTNLTHCATNQKCYVQRHGQGNYTRFTFGCLASQQCPDHQDFTIVGRSTSDHCLECCIQDGCNRELCEVNHLSAVHNPGSCLDDPATNCSVLSQQINICNDIQHAKIVCRKYCELCSLVDGDWTTWSDWSSCSTTCGAGVHTRSRTCTNPAPQHGGNHCAGNDTQAHACFLRECPVHGEWSTWSPWETCSVSCDAGVRKRHRTCTNPPPSLYGHYCIGDPVDFTICQEMPCNNITTKTNSTHPVTCTDVSTECAFANQTSGICSIQEYARKMCKKFCGLCSVVDGKWSTWSSWGQCSTTCNNGTWSRSRTCSEPAASNGGKPCTGVSNEIGTCNLRTCPVDGNWTAWSLWSGCSTSCGSGVKTRQRSCSNPTPRNGGHACSGSETQNAACQVFICPVDGGWSVWSSWSSCSQTCNGGEKKRQRNCTNLSPVGLGRLCEGNSDDVSVCNTVACPGFQIGFSAQGNTLTSSFVLRFTTVTTNIGNGYSSSTGAFTCSHPGLYYFSVTVITTSHIRSYGNNCSIRKNGAVQSATRTDQCYNYCSASTSLVVHLSQGDKVDIGSCTSTSSSYTTIGYNSLSLDSRSTFSGFLLVSD